MKNIFKIPGYKGHFNASSISSLYWSKGERNQRWVREGWITTRINKRTGKEHKFSFYVKHLEDWYSIKYLSHKWFNTRKPKMRLKIAGHFEKASIFIFFNGKRQEFEMKSNKVAKELYEEIHAYLKEQKFTCQFEKSSP